MKRPPTQGITATTLTAGFSQAAQELGLSLSQFCFNRNYWLRAVTILCSQPQFLLLQKGGRQGYRPEGEAYVRGHAWASSTTMLSADMCCGMHVRRCVRSL